MKNIKLNCVHLFMYCAIFSLCSSERTSIKLCEGRLCCCMCFDKFSFISFRHGIFVCYGKQGQSDKVFQVRNKFNLFLIYIHLFIYFHYLFILFIVYLHICNCYWKGQLNYRYSYCDCSSKRKGGLNW